ncbi:MAG TPA: hypothetical protein VFE98_06260 [Candidatus Bathyarchaeia archaeon]|nr:hypothetical protein [Candidatus Bathyarchaeia archaeon]
MPHVARLHAVLWGIFSLGGIIAAFLLPILIYLAGIAYPLGLWPVANDPTGVLVTRRLGILFIFAAIAGSLFHGLFRFQATLVELGLKRYSRALAGIAYTIFAISAIILVYYLLVLHPNFFKLSIITNPFF